MARILLIEDEVALSRGLVAALTAAGYSVDAALDGETGLLMAAEEPYAVITLDLGLPDMSGFDVLRRLRNAGSKTPILILTARDSIGDRVAGLDLGADDYLLKPFDPLELAARLRALQRRPAGEPMPIVRVGHLEVDRSRGVATINGAPVELRRREWAVLERLILKLGQVVTKERLSAEVFSYDDAVAPNAIELYVGRLRKKLEPDGPKIRTLRGLGYLMEAE